MTATVAIAALVLIGGWLVAATSYAQLGALDAFRAFNILVEAADRFDELALGDHGRAFLTGSSWSGWPCPDQRRRCGAGDPAGGA